MRSKYLKAAFYLVHYGGVLEPHKHRVSKRRLKKYIATIRHSHDLKRLAILK